MVDNLTESDIMLVEANHDINMLQVGPYPFYLKKRILGNKGHLSNETSGQLVNSLLHDKLKKIYLGHLSKENNYDKQALTRCRKRKAMKKCVITVVGKDTVGIIARVCTYLADTKVNILDISQTIVSGYFNMMMIVDMSGSTKNFDNVNEDLNKLGEDIGVVIKCQREEIFDMMHRI